jgi:hypothetical protein
MFASRFHWEFEIHVAVKLETARLRREFKPSAYEKLAFNILGPFHSNVAIQLLNMTTVICLFVGIGEAREIDI